MYYGSFNPKNLKQQTLEWAVSLVFGISCLLLYWFFPANLNDIVEVFLRLILFLFIFPIIYVRFILQKNFKDLGIGKYQYNSKSKFNILFSMISGLVVIGIISLTPLKDYYLQEILPVRINQSFKIFVIYQAILMPIILFIFLFYSFSFLNLITITNFKLNYHLSIFIFYLLMVSCIGGDSWQDFIIAGLLIIPTFFFKQIMYFNKNIWLVCIIFLSLNIILNTIIIKLSL
jgi:hypothetical protein